MGPNPFNHEHFHLVRYVVHSVFDYKGTPNDDLAKCTAVFEKGEHGRPAQEKWMLVHAHRGSNFNK